MKLDTLSYRGLNPWFREGSKGLLQRRADIWDARLARLTSTRAGDLTLWPPREMKTADIDQHCRQRDLLARGRAASNAIHFSSLESRFQIPGLSFINKKSKVVKYCQMGEGYVFSGARVMHWTKAAVFLRAESCRDIFPWYVLTLRCVPKKKAASPCFISTGARQYLYPVLGEICSSVAAWDNLCSAAVRGA